MKKFIGLLGSIILMFSLVACGAPNETSEKIKIATTSYALKYFIEAVGAEEIEVVYSLENNPHHFEVSQNDAKKIATADLFMNVEAGDYINIGQQLKNINQTMKPIDLASGIELLTSDEEHHHDHSHDEEHHKSDVLKEQLDPHVWLDPVKANTLVTNIKEALIEKNPEKEAEFLGNATLLIQKLSLLEDKMKQELTGLNNPYIVVNHAAYGYLAHRYDFEQKAINDMSDHSENTQTSLIEIDNFINDHQIKYILLEPNFEANSTVDLLTQKHNLEKLMIYNLETEVKDSKDYFELMEKNLESIKKATN